VLLAGTKLLHERVQAVYTLPLAYFAEGVLVPKMLQLWVNGLQVLHLRVAVLVADGAIYVAMAFVKALHYFLLRCILSKCQRHRIPTASVDMFFLPGLFVLIGERIILVDWSARPKAGVTVAGTPG